MSIISKQDSNGVKPLLQTGELGYDNYLAGNDVGRVWVGTGAANIALAKKTEVMAVDGKADAHIARVDNPHGVTKAQIGLGNADNTADINKIVASAGRLTVGKKINNVVFDNTQDITIKAETPNNVIVKFDGGATEGTDIYTFDGSENKSVDIIAGLNVQLVKTPGSVTINVDDIETKWDEIQNVPSPTLTLSGDVSGSAVMTELGSATLEVTIQPNSVELGVDTIGNYVGDVTGVEGITVTGAKGENWTPKIGITPVGIAGTYTKVTTNDKGQVINGGILSHTDIPNIDASKITSGVIDAARLPSYVDDILEFSSIDGFPLVGETGKIYVALDTNKTYRWGGTSYVYITSGAVDSVAGKTGVVILNKNDVGLNQVDNTSDADKPISTATSNALNLKANTASAVLTGIPTAPTAAVGTNTTQLATTAFVNAEIANDTYSKTQLDGGQLDNRYFTETELLNGALDVRYYTETEIDAKLAEQNDASEINYSNTTSGLVATKVQGAIDEVEGRLGVAETKIANANISRADKYLASQNIANMVYTNGDLTKIRYKTDSDVDYELLGYSGGNLSTIQHYVGSVLKGTTTLSYGAGNLVSAVFIAV
jgi:hypothetical protein